MSSTGVKIGYGSTVRIGRIPTVGSPPTPVFTQLTGLGDIIFPDLQAADVDVTHQESPGKTEETIPGMLSAADWSVDKHYIQGNAEDLLLNDLKATGETVILEITPPSGTPVEYSAYVKGYVPSLPIKEAMRAALTLRVSALIVD